MQMLPERIRLLDIDINAAHMGQLGHASTYTLTTAATPQRSLPCHC